MFELFGDQRARTAINDQRIHFASCVAALGSLLIRKGIVTEQELLDEIDRQKAVVDQIAAKQRDEVPAAR